MAAIASRERRHQPEHVDSACAFPCFLAPDILCRRRHARPGIVCRQRITVSSVRGPGPDLASRELPWQSPGAATAGRADLGV